MAMRELQAAQYILEKSLSEAGDAKRIKNIHLVMGELAELDQNIILQHWRELGKGTPAEHAQLSFRLKRAEVQCMACFGKYHPQNAEIHCPTCGSFGAKILSGEEFDFESIELDSEEK